MDFFTDSKLKTSAREKDKNSSRARLRRAAVSPASECRPSPLDVASPQSIEIYFSEQFFLLNGHYVLELFPTYKSETAFVSVFYFIQSLCKTAGFLYFIGPSLNAQLIQISKVNFVSRHISCF